MEENKVLDIKGDYVLYVDENDRDTSSEKKYWFVVDAEIYKDVKK